MKISKRQLLRQRMTYVSFFLFPATFIYFSPYVIVGATARGIMSGSFFMFGLLFLSALVLGRAFCGWLCPLGGGQDMLSPLSKRYVRKGNLIKWFLWTPWIIAIVVVAIRQGGYDTIDPLYGTAHGLSIGSIYTMIAYLLVLALVLGSFFIAGRRSFCHHLCWIAPFMILGRRIRNLMKLPSLKLNKTENDCTNCHLCTKNCPMSLEVEHMVQSSKMENPECILCGNCADVCRKGCIQLKFK
jgi:polyferredoxin